MCHARTTLSGRPRSAAVFLGLSLGLALAGLSAPTAKGQTIELISTDAFGAPVGGSYRPVISASGQYVAFESDSTAIVPGDTNGFGDIFVHDRVTGTKARVSVSSTGVQANADSCCPSISSTGRFVVFSSRATNLVPGGTNSSYQVFRRDRDTDADGIFDEPGAVSTILVSVNGAGTQGNSHSVARGPQSISADGNLVAFGSVATNLFAGADVNGAASDCFIRNVAAGTTTPVSLSTGGVQGNLLSEYPAISADGAFVAFRSEATNLVPGDTNGMPDVFVRSIAAGTTVRANVASDGSAANGFNWNHAISIGGGLKVAFASDATNLVPGDTNGASDVFVRDLAAGTTTRVSVSTAGAQAVGSNGPWCHLSADGTAVAFYSYAANLVAGDGNGTRDAFVRNLVTGVTVAASRAVDGTLGDDASGYETPVLSADASVVVFNSDASNLGPADGNDFPDIYVRGGPFLGPGGDGGGPMVGDADDNPVTFSVDGPVDPHTEGIRYMRGTPATPQIPIQPGNPIGAAIRIGPVPQASGLDSAFPGDVFDYDAAFVPSEAVMFQSPPFAPAAPGAPASPPDGTNNQILEPIAMGLAAGPGTPPFGWTMVLPGRDNVDAFSFGEDYFPPMVATGLDFASGFPPPPMDPMTGEILVGFAPWPFRGAPYAEPVVTDDVPGISFRFSVDPWSLGLAGTDLVLESLGADVGAGVGPWMSAGDAAGDVYGTPILMRIAGATVGGGANILVHDNALLALAPSPPPLDPFEDDLDALECVGDNSAPWFPGGMLLRPGNLHARVTEVGPFDPAPPGFSAHEPANDAPLFFSVTRNSPGVPFSGVRSQFVIDGGAAADIFVAVKDPMDPAGVGTNLLFIDNNEIGLYAMSDPMSGPPSPADFTDDLDALILWVCPEYRPVVTAAIEEILATGGGAAPWAPYGFGDALVGGGMTISITKYIAGTLGPIPPGCIRVGFSVTTDSIGLEYTGVDYEAEDPVTGLSQAAGDVFYAEVDGSPANTNYLWYEEVDLGEDAGVWMNGASADLADLSDNLNALDSIGEAPGMSAMFIMSTSNLTTGETLVADARVRGAAASLRVNARLYLVPPGGGPQLLKQKLGLTVRANRVIRKRAYRHTYVAADPRGRYELLLTIEDAATGAPLATAREPWNVR